MAHWTLDDLPWSSFDPTKVDPDLLAIAKAAALVEYNGATYVRYLTNVFADDPEFRAIAEAWGREEVQHGAALGRWAMLADPTFDLDAAFQRFTSGYQLTIDVDASIRGSRTGELIARCIVETGTSSYYLALSEAAEEPLLKEICRRIAVDELRHFKLFYTGMKQYLAREGIGFWGRLRVAASRIAESEDDELAYAYYAANGAGRPYDRRRWNSAYVARAYSLYRRHHLDRGMSMVFKAVGLKPHGRLNRVASALAWKAMSYRVKKLNREGALAA